jgi:multidrug efflux pump subunit AcrA (membrane-fusion protein)
MAFVQCTFLKMKQLLMKQFFRSLLFTAISIFVLISCNKQQESIHPTIEKITQSVYASGTVKSGSQYEVYAKVSGIIKNILVKEGELVKKGQSIIELSNTAQSLNYENAKLLAQYSSDNANQEKLTQANNELELAKSKLDNEASLVERQRKLWANEIGTKNDLDLRELAYKNAQTLYNASNLKLNDLKKQIALQSKQTQNSAAISSNVLNDFKVISEIDGKVYSIAKLAGEMATPQFPIAIIGNAGDYYVEMQVDEYDISKMAIGQKVFITMDSYQGKVFEATVSKVFPLMNQKTKSFKVEAVFTNKPENLFPNISAQANIVIQVKEKAMTIPRSYLIDNEYVYLKNKEKRKVKVGLMDYEKVEILSGINVTDELVKSIQ